MTSLILYLPLPDVAVVAGGGRSSGSAEAMSHDGFIKNDLNGWGITFGQYFIFSPGSTRSHLEVDDKERGQ